MTNDKNQFKPMKLLERAGLASMTDLLHNEHFNCVLAGPSLDTKSQQHQALIMAASELLAECERAQDELASALRDGIEHFNPSMLQAWFKGVTEAIDKAKG